MNTPISAPKNISAQVNHIAHIVKTAIKMMRTGDTKQRIIVLLSWLSSMFLLGVLFGLAIIAVVRPDRTRASEKTGDATVVITATPQFQQHQTSLKDGWQSVLLQQDTDNQILPPENTNYSYIEADIYLGGNYHRCEIFHKSMAYEFGAPYLDGYKIVVGENGTNLSELLSFTWGKNVSITREKIRAIKKTLEPITINGELNTIQRCVIFIFPKKQGYYTLMDTYSLSEFSNLVQVTIPVLEQYNPQIAKGHYVFVPGFHLPEEAPPEALIAAQPVVTAKFIGCPDSFNRATQIFAASGLFSQTPNFVWPSEAYYISGYHYNELVHHNYRHQGIDIGAWEGSKIFAVDNGIVAYTGFNGPYGNMVLIDHQNGYKTLYAHLEKITISCGAIVRRGEVIGLAGSTGNSSGPHLHFEIIHAVEINGQYDDKRENPAKFYPAILPNE